MEREERGDRFTAIEDQYADYTVYNRDYNKIGKVDDLFVDMSDQPEYIGVKMGLLGLRSILIPWEMARVNERRRLIEVAVDKETAKNAPTFNDDEEITPEVEERIYSHFGLQRTGGFTDIGGYGTYYGDQERISVERVPVEEGRYAAPGEIGEDEVVMPVTEEEVVTEKRPVVKEEIRVHKDIVEKEEVIEEDVRTEEVDVEDATTRGGSRPEADLDDADARRRDR